jgi:hypothetical protein
MAHFHVKIVKIRRADMKQLNVWPMLILLIVIVALVIWLRPH